MNWINHSQKPRRADRHPTQRRLFVRLLELVLLALLPGMLACNIPITTRWNEPTVAPPSPTPTPFLPETGTAPPPDPGEGEATVPAAPTVQPTPTPPAAAYQPVFEPSDCAFPVPNGYTPDCGYLVVPENRANPGGRSVRLHAAIFRSWSPNPAPDPVIHLAGGPGSSSLELAGYLFSVGLDSILNHRDFILFDQRGTGYSQPRLDCPERQALAPRLLDGSMNPEEEEAAIVESFRQCRERLTGEGVDLSTYNSAASAADVNDLRRALGYAQTNLYGVSYGSRLALTVMRDYPQAVRSAVLDSTYPPQFNLYTALAPNADRAFEVFFSRCAADPSCSASYPNLREVFYALADQLNASPATVELNTGSGTYNIRVDGGLLVDVLLVGLYNPAVAETMPQMIYDVRQGNYRILRQRLLLYFDDSSALGMTMAVQCGEEIPFSPIEEAYQMAAGSPPAVANFFPQSVRPLFATCAEWNPNPPDPRENQPVSSAIPTLILAGEFDPITPPDWGRAAAATLQNAQFYEIPGNGHWVTRSSRCALGMALVFWQQPGANVDAGCTE